METDASETQVDFDSQDELDANALCELNAEALGVVAGGLRACALLHIDK